MVSIDSVTPTVATASALTRDTKKTSTTANSDSMPISSTMGTDSITSAGPTGPTGVVAFGSANRFDEERPPAFHDIPAALRLVS